MERISHKKKLKFLIENSKVLKPDDPRLLRNRFKNLISEEGLDLLLRMLAFDPEDRISVTDALKHPFLKELHCEEDEPIREPLKIQDFDFEGQSDLTAFNYRCLLYEECLSVNFPQFDMQHIAGGKQIARIKSPQWQAKADEAEDESAAMTGGCTDWENDEEDL